MAIRIDGLPIKLGKELGSGGEGSVYEINEQPTLAAKIYHRLPLPADDVTKLAALVSRRSSELEQISSWPLAVLRDGQRDQPCGLLISKIDEAKHLHELYGTYNRRHHFPDALWHHLLLAARNVAAAFHSLHAAGVVVGDVNQGNLLVDRRMCVRFIDCDSFQITHNDKLFSCPVGTPHFTPPELQNTKLRDVARTPDHDRFGMAILIFHLLFVGRHPFAGRFRGPEELTIEKAIAERRFAFSTNKRETLVDPPPASLLLEDVPKPIGDLFEWAFRGRPGSNDRPTAKQWVEALEATMRRRRVCSFEASHVFFDQLPECPWCRVEDEGGPAFFAGGASVSAISPDRLAALDKKVRELTVRGFPALPEERLAPLPVPHPIRLFPRPKLTRLDAAAALSVAGVVLCLLSVVSPIVLIAGTACTVLGGGYLLLSGAGRDRRKKSLELSHCFAKIQSALRKSSDAITALHDERKTAYDTAMAEVRTECDHYQAEGSQLQDILVLQRGNQHDRYLAKHLLQDNVVRISGLTFSAVSMLESFGVESALNIDKLTLSCIPNMSPSLSMELLRWREQVETSFVFKPEHGITFRDLKHAEEVALHRFKISQARRVLTGAKQVDSLAATARYELDGAMKEHNELAVPGRGAADELKEFQSQRRPVERALNRSKVMLISLAIGAPLVGLAIYWWLG